MLPISRGSPNARNDAQPLLEFVENVRHTEALALRKDGLARQQEWALEFQAAD